MNLAIFFHSALLCFLFEGNKRKEVAEGMEDWDVEEIIISDQCKNNSNLKSYPNQKKGFYISALSYKKVRQK